MTNSFRITGDRAQVRLDQYLSQKISDLSRSKIQNLIRNGHILVNGQTAKPALVLNGGETIEYTLPERQEPELQAENIPLEILYEDEHIAVINKSAGMVVHPGNGNHSGTLVHALLYHFNQLSQITVSRPGIVHRLDKDTTGVIIIACSDLAHQRLGEAFARREVRKTYRALVWGKIPDSGTVEGIIGRHKVNRKLFAMVDRNGRDSRTKFVCETRYPPLAMVRLHPLTGRTHQLRVHMASLGHPILRDSVYGGGSRRIKSYDSRYAAMLKAVFKRQERVALHAAELALNHPISGEPCRWEAPLPADMTRTIEFLRAQYAA